VASPVQSNSAQVSACKSEIKSNATLMIHI
jgi:hypothetical protein